MNWIHGCLVWLLLGCLPASVDARDGARANENDLSLDERVFSIELRLNRWELHEAQAGIDKLLTAYTDQPVALRMAAWVKHHLGEHSEALKLFDRALDGLQNQDVWVERYSMVRAAARISKDWRREVSTDGDVAIQYGPGADRILTPYLIETVRRTLEVVGHDLGFVPEHPILVEILPDAKALSSLTGLTLEEIQTSGTIAVCRSGRLMITSPRATLKGFHWLDTVSHELVHLIISEKSLNRTPVWIHEALARYEDRRWRAHEPLYRKGLDPIEESILAEALSTDKWIRFKQMSPSIAMLGSQQAAMIAFAELYTVADFMVERKGYPGIRSMLTELGRGLSDFQSIQKVFGLKKREFVSAWLGWLAKKSLKRLRGKPYMQNGLSLNTGNKSTAERFLAKQSKIDLRDFFHLGQLLRARGRHSASVEEYKKAVARAGSDHAALWILANKLGLALLETNKIEEAKKAFQMGLSIKPDDLEAHLHLGEILLKTDPYRAWLHIREALRSNPLDPRVHESSFRAAEALSNLNDKRENWKEHQQRHREALQILSGAMR